MALLAIGCRLGIHPSLNALCEAARCHSAGAVRRLLVQAYGERGLVTAFQLAGMEQPPRLVSSQQVKGVEPAPGPPDLLSPEVLRSLPLQVARFFLHERRDPPPWRRQETFSERAHREMIEDCGSWVGE
jgi:hypothetical protein